MTDRLPHPGTREEESLAGGHQPRHVGEIEKRRAIEKTVAARDKGGGEREGGKAGGSGKTPRENMGIKDESCGVRM